MKTYWDTSAIIYCLHDSANNDLLLDGANGNRITRSHTLTEMFSTLTGGKLATRYSPSDASRIIHGISKLFTFVEFNTDDTLVAMNKAQDLNVHGGRIHDLIHVEAAHKAQADRIFTLNLKHFNGLSAIPIFDPSISDKTSD